MKTRKLLITLLGLLVIFALITACAPATEEPMEEPMEETEEVGAADPIPVEEQPYIPVISKGFQHQF